MKLVADICYVPGMNPNEISPPPRRNVEIKARVGSLDAARQVAQRLAAGYLGVLVQVETFFHCTSGRLKLREVDDRPAELIAYSRSDQVEPKPSQYYLVTVEEAAACKGALTAALGVAGVVRKRREVFLIDNVRIHLDEVDGLGDFLEMEAVISTSDEDEQATARLDVLMREFGILPENLLAGAYVDMLADIVGRIALRPADR